MSKAVRSTFVLALSLGMAFVAEICGKWPRMSWRRRPHWYLQLYVSKPMAISLLALWVSVRETCHCKTAESSGSQVSFSTTFDADGNSINLLYKCTVEGDQIKMTSEREGTVNPFVIKRVTK